MFASRFRSNIVVVTDEQLELKRLDWNSLEDRASLVWLNEKSAYHANNEALDLSDSDAYVISKLGFKFNDA